MAASATAQHNFAAIQLQLQTLQLENSALTKDVCLKENYIQLKDQQFRVMQRRLEELEAAVATWKNKYQQQLNVALAPAAAASPTSDDEHDAGSRPAWVAWKTKPAPAGAAARNVQQALALLERLSLADREKLRPMLAAITNSDGFAEALAESQWEEVFADVSEELSRLLLLYLLPVLLENHRQHAPGSTIHCYSRTYTKQTMDFRILCVPAGASSGDTTTSATSNPAAAPAAAASAADSPLAASAPGSSVPSSPNSLSVILGAESLDTTAPKALLSQAAAAAKDAPPPTYVRSLSSSANALQFPLGSPTSEFSSALRSAAEAESGEAEPVHLFDCVDADHAGKRNTTAPPVPHGPRELHATKAVYVSKAVAPTGSIVGSTSGSSSAMANRRYSLTPSRASTMLSSDTSRTSTMTSLSSPFTNGSGTAAPTDLSESGDRRSGASSVVSGGGGAQTKDGKIKKVLGSVMDRLNRHKPPPTTPSPSLEDDGDALCDGCGRGPIVGTKWVCRTCRVLNDKAYALCDKCYGQGIHGKENEDALFTRIEEIVVSKCSKLAGERELMKLLRVGICKANLKKFSFCLTWIADLLQCKQTKDLRARALEISQIAPHVRSEFVRLLTDLLARYRKDIELITEWQPVQASSAALDAATAVSDDVKGGVAALQLDTLRIWVKDSAESSLGGAS